MRWKGHSEVGSVGWLSWTIVNAHIDTLISSSADAGWAGVSNAGKICDMLKSGVVPEFGGGGDSNAKMIREIESLTTKDSGYAHLFESLTEMQRLCLFSSVLAEGRRDERGQPPLNAVVASQVSRYAAELGMKAPRKRLTPVNFSNHLSLGRKAFFVAITTHIKKAAEEAAA